jgi:predicted nucleotidyltransferase
VDEIETMRRNLRSRERSRREELARLLDRARADFARIASHIALTYGPRRIWQWGSLLDERHFTERSDIDLALEGVDSADAFFAILRDAEAMTTFPVDIVQLETIHPEFADSIRSRGRVVYER